MDITLKSIQFMQIEIKYKIGVLSRNTGESKEAKK